MRLKASSTCHRTDTTAGKNPQDLAKLLEETELFATAHKAAASEGQSSLPVNNDTDEHFVAFVHAPDPVNAGKHRLIELDGRRKVPVDLGESGDLLKVDRTGMDYVTRLAIDTCLNRMLPRP